MIAKSYRIYTENCWCQLRGSNHTMLQQLFSATTSPLHVLVGAPQLSPPAAAAAQLFGAQGCCLIAPWIRCPDRILSAAVISAARSLSGLSLALGSACIWFCIERKLDCSLPPWLTNTSALELDSCVPSHSCYLLGALRWFCMRELVYVC